MTNKGDFDVLDEIFGLQFAIHVEFIESDHDFGKELVEDLDVVPKGVDFPWVVGNADSAATLWGMITTVREGLATLSREELRLKIVRVLDWFERFY